MRAEGYKWDRVKRKLAEDSIQEEQEMDVETGGFFPLPDGMGPQDMYRYNRMKMAHHLLSRMILNDTSEQRWDVLYHEMDSLEIKATREIQERMKIDYPEYGVPKDDIHPALSPYTACMEVLEDLKEYMDNDTLHAGNEEFYIRGKEEEGETK